MKKYSKEPIINEIKNLLKYYSDDKKCVLFANLLLSKVNEKTEIILNKEEISCSLFSEDNNEINNTIFYCLSRLNADLSEINFDGKNIKGLNFSNLQGVVINLDMIPQKDLSKVKFRGVTLNGTLDNAIIEYTDFTGYIGDISLNPQTVINKSMKGSKLSGVTINGNFDNVEITGVDFSDAKGTIIINPQKVPNKELISIDFSNVLLCGYDDENNEVLVPVFDDCQIYGCKFKNTKGPITINLDSLMNSIFPKLSMCDLTGVVVEGNAKSNYEPIHCVNENGYVVFNNVGDDLFGSYYYDERGNCVHIYLYQSMRWDNKSKRWKYVSRKKEHNLKFNVEFKKIESQEKKKQLSLFSKK